VFKFFSKFISAKEVTMEDVEKLDDSARNRLEYLPNGFKKIIQAIAIGWTLFQVYTGFFGQLPSLLQRSVTLGFCMVLTFLCYGLRKKKYTSIPIYDYILAAISIGSVVYLWLNYRFLVQRAGSPTLLDVIIGIALVFIVLDITRRTVGMPLVIVAGCFLVYGLVGPYMPDLLAHRGYSLFRISSHMYLTLEGIFGIPLSVMTTFVYAFILFGCFLEATGGAKLFINLAYAIAGRSPGGPAKTAVVSSALLGTISGSSLANVVTTGSFTIPLMKKCGYKPSFAGGVEASSSSAGQIMPPVMGAAAFIMAEMTGIPYLKICIAAAIPAVLYYVSIFITVHLEALKVGLKPIPDEELPKLKDALKNSLPLLVPVAAIIFLLVIGYTPLKAALYSTVLMIISSAVNKETRLSRKKFIEALEKTAYNSIAVTAACAVCGIVTGIVTLTGVGLKISDIILTISHGSLFWTLFLTMIASIILGMGLPTTAKYIVLSTIAVPALLSLKVPLVAAHLFILYFGVIAEVTPPVALTSYAGAAIARAPGVETALQGLRISIAAFFIPYIFVYYPSLLFESFVYTDFIIGLLTSFIGVFCLSAGLTGYLIDHNKRYESVALFFGGLLLLKPGAVTDTVGIGIFIIIFLMQKLKKRGKAFSKPA